MSGFPILMHNDKWPVAVRIRNEIGSRNKMLVCHIRNAQLRPHEGCVTVAMFDAAGRNLHKRYYPLSLIYTSLIYISQPSPRCHLLANGSLSPSW